MGRVLISQGLLRGGSFLGGNLCLFLGYYHGKLVRLGQRVGNVFCQSNPNRESTNVDNGVSWSYDEYTRTWRKLDEALGHLGY